MDKGVPSMFSFFFFSSCRNRSKNSVEQIKRLMGGKARKRWMDLPTPNQTIPSKFPPKTHDSLFKMMAPLSTIPGSTLVTEGSQQGRRVIFWVTEIGKVKTMKQREQIYRRKIISKG